MKCTFYKLIFNLDVFYMFQARGFIFRKMVEHAVMVWYVIYALV